MIVLCGIVASFPSVAQPVILLLDTSAAANTVITGESTTFEILVENRSAVVTATNPIVTISLPEGATGITSPDCEMAAPLSMTCSLAEVPPNTTETLAFTTAFTREGHNVVDATVIADQENYQPGWRTGDEGTVIVAVTTTETLTDSTAVDLALELAFTASSELHLPYPVTATVKNLHDHHTVIAPVVEFTTPVGWTIWPGKHCSPTGRTVSANEVVRCLTAPLIPNEELAMTMIYTPVNIDGADRLTATASSTQPDNNEQNNAAQVETTIIPTVFFEILCGASNPLCLGGTETTPDTDTSEPEPAAAMPDSVDGDGGGTIPPELLLLVFCLLSFRRKDQLIRWAGKIALSRTGVR